MWCVEVYERSRVENGKQVEGEMKYANDFKDFELALKSVKSALMMDLCVWFYGDVEEA